jgi:iron complex transport system permease protein
VERRQVLTLLSLAALLAAAVAALLLLGLGEVTPDERAMILGLRGQRAGMAAVVGAALAVAGVMLQSLLRNPLASPDLLGLASGAGLAVMVSTTLAGAAGGLALGAGGAGAAALAGSTVTLAAVYALSQRRGFLDPVTLVLVGVIVSVMCGAASMFIAVLSADPFSSVARWTIGALDDNVPASWVWGVGTVVVVSTLVGAWSGPAMDAAALSDDEARSVGVPLGALRLLLFGLAGVLTAGAVVLAGPIGFVGLVCPHVARLLAGPSHRVVVLASALAGAAMLVLADLLVGWLRLPGGRVPIGVVTAVLGGPILIVLLRRFARHVE